MTVSYHVSAANWVWVLWKTSQLSQSLSSLFPGPALNSFYQQQDFWINSGTWIKNFALSLTKCSLTPNCKILKQWFSTFGSQLSWQIPVSKNTFMFYNDTPYKGQKSSQSLCEPCLWIKSLICVLKELQFKTVIFFNALNLKEIKEKPNHGKLQHQI